MGAASASTPCAPLLRVRLTTHLKLQNPQDEAKCTRIFDNSRHPRLTHVGRTRKDTKDMWLLRILPRGTGDLPHARKWADPAKVPRCSRYPGAQVSSSTFVSSGIIGASSGTSLTNPASRVTVAVGATSNVSVVPVPGSTSLPKSGVVNLNPSGGANLRK